MPDAPTTFRYKRVLLKVSGEVLMGDQSFGVDMKTVDTVAKAVADVAAEGIEICLVSAAATSSVVCPRRRRAWSARRPTIWACWPPS